MFLLHFVKSRGLDRVVSDCGSSRVVVCGTLEPVSKPWRFLSPDGLAVKDLIGR